MTLFERLKHELTTSIKTRDATRKDGLRLILGELNRLNTKTPSDDIVVSTCIKIAKMEQELLESQKLQKRTSSLLLILEEFIPEQVSKDEIITWINDNIDLSQFKNKNQAMKPIMSHFGKTADGNLVRTVLQQM